MKMKLIISLLVLCLAFSIGSALAQTDMGSMEKSTAGSTGRMTGSSDHAVVVVAGNVTGKVTYTTPGKLDQMNGIAGKANMAGNGSMAGNMGVTGKIITRNINGHLLIVKDIEKNVENIVIIGKVDGMPGKAVIIGKIDLNNAMARTQKEDMSVTSGNMENMAGITDDQKVIVTGTINCNMIGDMIITGKTSAMAGMSGYGSEDMAGMSGPNNMEQPQDNMSESQNNDMAGTAGNMDNMPSIDNRKVIATGTVKLNMTGDLVVIGKMGVIKEMVGYKKEGMTEKMSGMAESGNKEMEMYGPQKADMNENMGSMAEPGSCAAESKKNEMNGMYRNLGNMGEKMKNVDVMMFGVVRCKMSGINLVVVGKADEMAGMMGGMTGKSCMAAEKGSQPSMTASEENMADTGTMETKTCGENKAQGTTAKENKVEMESSMPAPKAGCTS